MYEKKSETVKLSEIMFNKLHEVEEIDFFLDKGREFFRRRYNIDYFSVHILHHSRYSLLGFFDHDQWNDWVYDNNRGITHKDQYIHKIKNKIKPNEFYLEYFDIMMGDREINRRAEIIGERKYGGCTLITSDDANNITEYDITFKDDAAFGTLDKKILYELTADLIRYKSLLLPFAEHLNLFGSFTEHKNILDQSINNYIKDNHSLFYF